MEHKAFVFDYDTFIQELGGILQDALITSQKHELINFIEKNLPYLKHPEQGEPLNSYWEAIIETEDISEYADLAITKYYNPNLNIGLGYDWWVLNDMICNELEQDISPLLGVVFRTNNNIFDPGKMGTYFQSLE